ncbi:MAG: dihydrodipicolinate synthase family protein [Eubacteriales bacterium]|nr:dihydrodipicolinate synthase family protein [Eubacteriales bacterium]
MNAEYLTPVVTLFDQKGGIDKDSCRRLYDRLIESGLDGLVILGSAGEFFGMSMTQRRELTRFALGEIAGRTKVLIGTGCMNIDDTVTLSNEALDLGADGVMIVGPYYINLSAESIIQYYDQVAERVRGPIYLYNYPERTGYDLTPEITLTLLRRHRHIVGYKDTVSSMVHTRDLINAIRPDYPEFRIYAGYDENFAHTVLSGGNGCIGALSNLVPEICSDWFQGFQTKDLMKVAANQQKINRLMPFYAICTPFMPAMKAALNMRGFAFHLDCTYPITPPTGEQIAAVRELLVIEGLI